SSRDRRLFQRPRSRPPKDPRRHPESFVAFRSTRHNPRRESTTTSGSHLYYIWMARPARLEYLVLLDSPDLEESRSDELEVTVRMRATDGGRFDEAVGGRAGLAVDEMPKWAQTEIARCQRYATICASVPEDRARPIVEAAETLLL